MDCSKSGNLFTFTDKVSYGLSLPGSSQQLRSAKIVISCIGIKPENELDAINDIVNDAQVSPLTAPRGLDEAGAIINGASTIVSSDSFTTVMGYVEGIVKIGDAIAEVSSFTAAVVDERIQPPTGPSLCKSCMVRVDVRTEGR